MKNIQQNLVSGPKRYVTYFTVIFKKTLKLNNFLINYYSESIPEN